MPMSDSPYDVPKPDVSTESIEKFRAKVEHMIADFTGRGFHPLNVAPPFYRWAWALGWKLTPPLFADFWKTAAFLGAIWGIGWGILMYFLMPSGGQQTVHVDGFGYVQTQDDSGGLDGMVTLGRFAGVFFGLFMACYYLWARHAYQIPAWADYPNAAARTAPTKRRAVRQVADEEDIPEVALAEDEPRPTAPRRRQDRASASASVASSDDPRWLAGTWQGTVTIQAEGQVHEIPFTMHFDRDGRPIMDLAAGQPTLITHVGQQIRAGSTTFTVEELSWPAGGCRVVLTVLQESFQQYGGVGGPGVASASTSSTSSARTVAEFRRRGDALQVRMQTQSETASSMRVLDGGSTDRQSSEMNLAGVLYRA
jgi:hypothetical protein